MNALPHRAEISHLDSSFCVSECLCVVDVCTPVLYNIIYDTAIRRRRVNDDDETSVALWDKQNEKGNPIIKSISSLPGLIFRLKTKRRGENKNKNHIV